MKVDDNRCWKFQEWVAVCIDLSILSWEKCFLAPGQRKIGSGQAPKIMVRWSPCIYAYHTSQCDKLFNFKMNHITGAMFSFLCDDFFTCLCLSCMFFNITLFWVFLRKIDCDSIFHISPSQVCCLVNFRGWAFKKWQ